VEQQPKLLLMAKLKQITQSLLVLVEAEASVVATTLILAKMALMVLIQFFPQLHLLVAVVAVATTAAVVEVVLVAVDEVVVQEQLIRASTVAVAITITLEAEEVREHRVLLESDFQAALAVAAYQII
jgi:hypothetical protein